MIQFDNSARIFISTGIFREEWEYMFGSKKNEAVTFTFCNVKTGKETERTLTYSTALELAIMRSRDGRYKNFEFWITK